MHPAGPKRVAAGEAARSREGRMSKARSRSPGARAGSKQEVTFADKVSFLSRPDAYAGAAGPVQVVETHMSVVFLSGRFAHKLKKPVHYEFLDFRTLAARRRSSQYPPVICKIICLNGVICTSL